MTTPRFDHFFPDRPVDASHPEILLDFNRCILCELCVRASAEVDGKQVSRWPAAAWASTGRELRFRSVAHSQLAATDKAVEVCPVAVILRKRVGFATPVGQRRFDERADQRPGARLRAALHEWGFPRW